MLYPVHPEKFRRDVRRKSFLGLINVKNIEGNLKNAKNVLRQILITTGMYVKVKTHMEDLEHVKKCIGYLTAII